MLSGYTSTSVFYCGPTCQEIDWDNEHDFSPLLQKSIYIFTCPTFFNCETFAKFCNVTVTVDVADSEAVEQTAENRPANTLTCPTFFKCETFAKLCNITLKVDVTDIEAVDKTAENRPTYTVTCPTFFNVQQVGTVPWHAPLQPKPP